MTSGLRLLRLPVFWLAASLALIPMTASADAVGDANAGADALAAGQYARAVELFTSAIKTKKLSREDLESAYVERGKAYLGEHQNKLAEADFDRALKLNPSDEEAASLRDQASGSNAPVAAPGQAQFDAGKALWQSGDCAGAETQLRAGLASDPYNAAANYYLADCLVKSNNYSGAALPLRLAVQYGAALPEGQMAADEAKRLSGLYAPRDGIAMGCAAPVPPPALDGATATRAQMMAAQSRLDTLANASSRFEACLNAGFTELQNQVAAQGRTYTGTALERKFQGAIDKNQQAEQDAQAQYQAALAAYNAAHPSR